MSTVKQGIKKRGQTLFWAFVAAGMAVVASALYIQWGPEGDALRKKGMSGKSFKNFEVEAVRGDILGYDGKVMATTVPYHNIYMDPNVQHLTDSVFMANVGDLAASLAAFFKDKPASAYKQLLVNARNQKKRHVKLSPRRVNHMEMLEIAQFPILRWGQFKGGFVTDTIEQRVRPYGTMAMRLVGSINMEGYKTGLEGAYDSILRGKNGFVTKQKVAGNFWAPVQSDTNIDPIDGFDIVTTLDADLQDIAETALRKQVLESEADWGTVVLMEVATGEIRAMANVTRRGNALSDDQNYAIRERLEPGSTIKLASLMMLLDDAGMTLDDQVDTGNGEEWIGHAPVTDSHGYGVLSLKGVFEHSSNIGFGKLAYQHYSKNPQRYVDNLKKMGLTEAVGLQELNTAKPVVYAPGDRMWSGQTLVTMAYGYGLMYTPIQLLTLYNAVANDGKMIAPVIVKEVRKGDQVVQRYKTHEIVSSVCSRKTLSDVRSCLEGVVEDGTGKQVMKGLQYKVAGKTGTARYAINGNYDVPGGRHYIGTFVGYFPADAPKYSCIVILKTFHPTGSNRLYYGSGLSGPVFRAIADRIQAREARWESIDRQKHYSELPLIKGGRYADIRRVGDKLDIDYTEIRAGNNDPVSVTKADSLKKLTVSPVEIKEGTVPDVIGFGLQDALYLLESNGLVVSFSGLGRVTGQSLPAGQPCSRGTNITLTLGI